jgi:mannose-1-phosphate guanylyltransferase / mannose-6-phosphate isomerase
MAVTQAERVKGRVGQMKAQNRNEALEHRRIYRAWGFYQTADLGSRYQVKIICVNSGGRLSLEKHFHRAEHWVVVRGVAEVTIGDEVRLVHENNPFMCRLPRYYTSTRQPGKDPVGVD